MSKCDKCDVRGTCGLPKKINEAAADYGLTVEITACAFEKQWGCAGSDFKGEWL